MKKLLLFLIALPLLCIVAVSCSDDKTPDVNVMAEYANGVVSNGKVYVVKGDTLIVDSLYVEASNAAHKAMIIGPVSYYLNGYPVLRVIIPPYRLAIPTDSLAVGAYQLQIVLNVAEEDFPLAVTTSEVSVNVVGSIDDVPSDTTVNPHISRLRNI